VERSEVTTNVELIKAKLSQFKLQAANKQADLNLLKPNGFFTYRQV
jgi:hypothetical protein